MQTFDGALLQLYQDQKISLDEALRNADSKNNLRLKVTLSEKSPTPPTPAPEPATTQKPLGKAPSTAHAKPAAQPSALDGLSLEPLKADEPDEEETTNMFFGKKKS